MLCIYIYIYICTYTHGVFYVWISISTLLGFFPEVLLRLQFDRERERRRARSHWLGCADPKIDFFCSLLSVSSVGVYRKLKEENQTCRTRTSSSTSSSAILVFSFFFDFVDFM